MAGQQKYLTTLTDCLNGITVMGLVAKIRKGREVCIFGDLLLGIFFFPAPSGRTKSCGKHWRTK